MTRFLVRLLAAGVTGYCICQLVETAQIFRRAGRGPKISLVAAITWGTIVVLVGFEAASLALGIPAPFLRFIGYFSRP